MPTNESVIYSLTATICAEHGVTDRQMMALFDWTSESMATPYTKKANKAKMAATAAGLLGSFSWDRLAKVSRKAEGFQSP
jgi:hypothetical protein